jgi:hypothetical protein
LSGREVREPARHGLEQKETEAPGVDTTARAVIKAVLEAVPADDTATATRAAVLRVGGAAALRGDQMFLRRAEAAGGARTRPRLGDGNAGVGVGRGGGAASAKVAGDERGRAVDDLAAAVERGREREASELDLAAIGREEDVRGVEVAQGDTLTMERVEGQQNLQIEKKMKRKRGGLAP